MITSKPANGESGRDSCFLRFHLPLVYSILINPSGIRFSFLFITMSSSRGCGNCGKLGGLLPSFPSAVGTVENKQFVFHGFQLRGSFHSLRPPKALSARFGKKLGPHSSSNEFFAAAEWYGLPGGGEFSTQPAWAVNSVLVRQLRGPNFRMWP